MLYIRKVSRIILCMTLFLELAWFRFRSVLIWSSLFLHLVRDEDFAEDDTNLWWVETSIKAIQKILCFSISLRCLC